MMLKIFGLHSMLYMFFASCLNSSCSSSISSCCRSSWALTNDSMSSSLLLCACVLLPRDTMALKTARFSSSASWIRSSSCIKTVSWDVIQLLPLDISHQETKQFQSARMHWYMEKTYGIGELIIRQLNAIQQLEREDCVMRCNTAVTYIPSRNKKASKCEMHWYMEKTYGIGELLIKPTPYS